MTFADVNLLARQVSFLSGASRNSGLQRSNAACWDRGEDRMNEERNSLAARVAALEARVADLADYLHSALEYLSSDPQSSLTKSRVILEKLLLALYRAILRRDPVRP